MNLRHHKVSVAALVVLVLIVLACLAAPLISHYQPNTSDLASTLLGPSPAHLLGTDELGRDILTRLLYGGRPALGYALVVVLTSTVIALPLGLTSGYLGGRTDRWIMRFTDLGLAVPAMIIVLVILSVFGDQFLLSMVALGVLLAPPMIRNVRGPALAVREELYVDAARTAGLSANQIMFRHILPRIRGPVLVQVTLTSAIALLLTTSLAFLGFGVPVPSAAWGTMIAESTTILSQSPWLLIASGGAIGLSALCLGLVGDGIRDIAVQGWTGAPRRRAPVRVRPAAAPLASAQPQLQTSDALLAVTDLTLAYPRGEGEVIVASDVTFSVRRGEILGLVGESGCGKTSVARAILRLLRGDGRITGGSIGFDGRDVLALSPTDLRGFRGAEVAYISQEPMVALDPTYRVGTILREAVLSHERLDRVAVRARVRELLEMVSLRDPDRVARLFPHELSGGMAQRVSIARALAGRPRLLVADEPTTALDATVQAGILRLLRRLRDDTGMAILLVSHDWNVVEMVCDRAVVMYAGQVVEDAPIALLTSNPAHPYTEGLLLCQPRLARAGATRLPTITGSVPDPKDWPESCHFTARCPYRIEACTAGPIPLITSGPARTSRCIRIEQVLESSRLVETTS